MNTQPPPNISVDDVLSAVGPPTTEPPKELKDSKSEADREKVELEGRSQFFGLRGLWSFWIILWISIQLLFQIVLTACLGLAWLDFKAYPYFLPIVTIQTFLQIVGMGLIVVNFLYEKTPAK
jgi:hypothetical protein